MGNNVLVDVAIIGTGSAGMRAYRQARRYTNHIALIEGGEYGTTCARVGCMPSKLLIAPAEAAHRAQSLAEFGINIDKVEVLPEEVMKRVRNERDRFVGFIQQAVETFDEAHRYQAYASFVDDHHLQLTDGTLIEAKTIVIAVGSTPFIPDYLSELGDKVVTSDQLFYWNTLPRSVAVVGTGIIGLELGQALHRLGVRVRIFSRRTTVGPLTDPYIKQYALDTFQSEMPYSENSRILSTELNSENGVNISYQDSSGATHLESFDCVLAATGRRPNLDKLSLEKTSLSLNEKGIPEFNPYTMQCGQSHIFIAGDATGQLELLHEAGDEGNIAGDNAGRYPAVVQRQRRCPLAVMFTEPQIALVGRTHQELIESNTPFVTATADFEDQGRARVMLKHHGKMNLYASPETGQLLGAEMIGPEHEHLAHELAWCIQRGLTVAEMLQLPYYHPTVEEGMADGLAELLEQLGGDVNLLPPELK